jgi:hypothetical protein
VYAPDLLDGVSERRSSGDCSGCGATGATHFRRFSGLPWFLHVHHVPHFALTAGDCLLGTEFQMTHEPAFCALRAAEARQAAQRAELANIRERHLRAAAVWDEFGQRAYKVSQMRQQRALQKQMG